jgi:glycerol-3-phosphate dehydrogenase
MSTSELPEEHVDVLVVGGGPVGIDSFLYKQIIL